MKIEVNGLENLPFAATQVLDFLKKNHKKFLILRGAMGAGKTTLVNELILQLGVLEHGSSPTFSIVNEYFSVNYGTIYHFDFYRIEDEVEAFDIGIEEIFESDSYIFVEWPERIENLLPPDIVSLTFDVKDEKRTLELLAL